MPYIISLTGTVHKFVNPLQHGNPDEADDEAPSAHFSAATMSSCENGLARNHAKTNPAVGRVGSRVILYFVLGVWVVVRCYRLFFLQLY
mmetsp:Transcript_26559/g.74305  ORF Transcript_26559/g.74305 Transcript_26559/m.74305 type:complete len:89 (+) Transcript_26559:1527-1793(+)